VLFLGDFSPRDSQHDSRGAPLHDEAERSPRQLHHVGRIVGLLGGAGDRDRNLEPRTGGVGDLDEGTSVSDAYGPEGGER